MIILYIKLYIFEALHINIAVDLLVWEANGNYTKLVDAMGS